MSQEASRSTSEFNPFISTARGTIAAVGHDMHTDKNFVNDLMYGLTEVNSGLATSLLSSARDAKEAATDPETAYLEGALTVIAILVKQERAKYFAEQQPELSLTADDTLLPTEISI